MSASNSFALRLSPIRSEVMPKRVSLISELTAPIAINTTQVKMFLITSSYEPDFIAFIAFPMKLGKKKSVMLPRNMNGNPKSKINHCSAKKPRSSLFCWRIATLSFSFCRGFLGWLGVIATAFATSGVLGAESAALVVSLFVVTVMFASLATETSDS